MADIPLKINCKGCRSRYDVSDLEPFSTFACPLCGLTLRVPQRFGHFILEKICGRGGMSKIYRAVDLFNEKRVAVKILDADCDDPALQNGYRNEYDMLFKLIGVKGIVQVYDVGVIDGVCYMTMQYLPGGDVEHCMKNGRLPDFRTVAGWLADVGAGLHAAHQKGICHHDVKPSNIFITQENSAVLGDFDLADYRKDGDLETPCHGWASPAYVSPERLYGGGEDFRGDIFSFGVTIYELLGGRLPFSMSGESVDLYEERRKMEFPDLKELAPELDAEISDIVRRMMSFDHLLRPDYPEAVAVLRKLESL